MLHNYARFVAAATIVLLFAGGMVTSTGSGLAVPDWPNSYGHFMFSFPLSKMVGGVFYEHGHRLIASTVGLLTIGLAVWLWLAERRRWVKRLGVIALAAVILQGLLGGITVLFFLPAPVSIGHAGLAQIFFCLTIAIALVTSPGWRAGDGTDDPVTDRTLCRLATTLTVLIYVQILAGATMRHTDAGLAIPDFPLAFGHLVPPQWTAGIAIHFSHRLGAIAVLALAAVVIGRIRSRHRSRRELLRPALLLGVLIAAQITLGALTVLTQKAVLINSLHVVVGALVLATSLVVTLRMFRARIAAAENACGAAPSLSMEVRTA